MLNVVYLVLIITGGSGMMTTQSIPQANMKQCQTNSTYLQSKKPSHGSPIIAYCIAGVK